jgi:predicted Zn-dependent protease
MRHTRNGAAALCWWRRLQREANMRLLALLAFAVCGLASAGPLIDFREDLAFHAQAVDRFAASAYDKRLQQLRSARHLDGDAQLAARLHAAFERIVAIAEEEKPGAARLPWEIHTCHDCGENASALAGGRLLFGEEFVASLALSDDELAFLVAHEMAHVLCEHSRELATAARYFLDNGLNRDYWDIQRELDDSLSAQYRVEFVASDQELEADRVGLILGARAGFDPDSMQALLAKILPASDSPSATHPTRARRLEQARGMLPIAKTLYVPTESAGP